MTTRFSTGTPVGQRQTVVQFSDAEDVEGSSEEAANEPSPYDRHRISRISLDRFKLVDREAAPSTGSSTLVDSYSPQVSNKVFGGLQTPLLRKTLSKHSEEANKPSEWSARASRAFDRILRNSANGNPEAGNLARQQHFHPDEEDPMETPLVPIELSPPKPSFGSSSPRPLTSTPRRNKTLALSTQTPRLPGHYISTTPFARPSFKTLAQQDETFHPSPKTPHWPGEYKSIIHDSFQDENRPPEASTSSVPYKASTSSPTPLRRRLIHSPARTAQPSSGKEEVLSTSQNKIKREHLLGSPTQQSPIDEVSGSDTDSIQPSDEESIYDTEGKAKDGDLPEAPPNSLKAKLLANRRAVDQQIRDMEKARRAIAQESKQRRKSEGRTLQKRLIKAEKLDDDLRARASEIKKTINDVGAQVGAKISESVGETLRQDSRRRHRWLWCALATEVGLLYLLYSYMHVRLRREFQTSFYDPFNDFLYSASTGPLVDVAVPAETIALFAPFAYSLPDGPFSTVHSLLANSIAKLWAHVLGAHDVFPFITPT